MTKKVCWLCKRTEKEVKQMIDSKSFNKLKRTYHCMMYEDSIYSYAAGVDGISICPVCAHYIYQTISFNVEALCDLIRDANIFEIRNEDDDDDE